MVGETYPEEYESGPNMDVSPAFNVREVDEVTEYCKKHAKKLTVKSRYEKDIKDLEKYLEKLKKDGVIVDE